MSTQNVAQIPRHTLASISPVTGELLCEFEQHSDEVINTKLQHAADTFHEYRKLPFSKRAQMMTCVAETLEKGKDQYARLMTREMGRLL